MATVTHGGVFQYTFNGAPPWAVCGQAGNPACVYGGSVCAATGWPNITWCKGIITKTADMQAFITAVMNRYNGVNGHGLISVFEVNNEDYYMNGTVNCTTSGTTGPTAIFAQTVDLEVKAAKAGNPNTLIAAFGLTSINACFASGEEFDGLWTAWGSIAGNSRGQVNAISFHDYPDGCCGGATVPVPEEVAVGTGFGLGSCFNVGFIPCVQAAITRLGISSSVQLWDTESSWGINSQLPNSTNQVAYVAREELLLWAKGVSRHNWYSWNESAWGTMCTGSPCTANANATAYQQIYNWMVGSTMTSNCAASGTVWTCGLKNSSGVQTQAVWNTAGSSTYTVSTGYGHYKDLAGNSNTISGSTVTIGIQPILLVP